MGEGRLEGIPSLVPYAKVCLKVLIPYLGYLQTFLRDAICRFYWWLKVKRYGPANKQKLLETRMLIVSTVRICTLF
jgi:hypothetical protein